MAQATFTFPREFLWGSATSSYQVEGNNFNNNWHAWELHGHIHEGHSCGLACDWWGGRWREDFERAAETHQNAHRFSVEWSRIQPTPDRWDEDAIDQYRQMACDLIDRGLKPMVTLHHFTDPLWFDEFGGWENQAVVPRFEAFVRRVVEALKEYVDTWVTINEPNVFASLGYATGDFPPGKKNLRAFYRVVANMIRAHAAAYNTIHELQPGAQVGLAHNYRGFQPDKAWSPLDKLSASLFSNVFNDAIPGALNDGVFRFAGTRKRIPGAHGTQDFLGLNYYTCENIAFAPFAPGNIFTRQTFPPGAELSPTGFFANRPEFFFQALKWALQFKLPIIVTENGVEDPGDDFRRRYLVQHIHQMWRAVNYTWPVRGYFYWSLVDNFEWERGWTQRFGLWELDTETQTRTKRPSVDLYAEICQQSALSSEMVARYVPELFGKMFPN
jgi:beta-glucosidase